MNAASTAPGIAPEQYARRSQLYRRHREARARFEAFAGAAVVAAYADVNAEAQQAKLLSLADLSVLPRIGFKGAGALAWADAHGAKAPPRPNRALPQEDGSVVARLSVNELLILDNLDSNRALPGMLEDRWRADLPSGVYPLPRRDSHCWLALTGSHASATLAKLCAIDFRLHKFADYQVAQTSIARGDAIVIRADLGPTPRFDILCDASAAEYLWDALLDAMAEFRGTAVGIAALRTLRSERNGPGKEEE